MIGPEATGFDNYVTAYEGDNDVKPHWYSGNPRVSAIGNHLYDAGVTFDNQDFFDRLKRTLDNARKEANMTMTKRLFMVRFRISYRRPRTRGSFLFSINPERQNPNSQL